MNTIKQTLIGVLITSLLFTACQKSSDSNEQSTKKDSTTQEANTNTPTPKYLNSTNKRMEQVTFKSEGLNLKGNLYYPKGY